MEEDWRSIEGDWNRQIDIHSAKCRHWPKTNVPCHNTRPRGYGGERVELRDVKGDREHQINGVCIGQDGT